MPNLTSVELIRNKSQYFRISSDISYHGFCEDFEAMNLASIYRFCDLVNHHAIPDGPITLVPDSEPGSTNTVYFTRRIHDLCLDCSIGIVSQMLTKVNGLIVSFHDVSPGKQNFHLSVLDCFEGLWKSKSIGCVDFLHETFDLQE